MSLGLQGVMLLVLSMLGLPAWSGAILDRTPDPRHEMGVPRQPEVAVAEAVIALPPHEVLRWLSNPDLMSE